MTRSAASGPTVFALVSGSFGGGQKIALQVAEALVSESIPIAACSPTDGIALDRFRALGAEISTLGEVRTHDLRLLRRTRDWLKGIDARCLYTHTVPTHETVLGRGALEAETRLVVHRHIIGAFSGASWKRAIQMKLWRGVLRRASAIPSVSNEVGDQIRNVIGVEPTVIYNGVAIPADPGPTPERAPVVGFIGRIDPHKRVEDFIMLAAHLRARRVNARFVLVGASDEPDAYERSCLAMIDSQGLKGHIEVRRFATNVQTAMLEIDILVMPSILEGHPLALLEAMALRRAVVAAYIPGCRETVTDGVDGRLFTPLAQEELVGIVTELVNDKAARDRLGASARSTVIERFPIDGMLDRLLPLVR